MDRPGYPPARRLDLVEQLPAEQPTYPVADPYRWLEQAAEPEVEAWSSAQDALCRDHLDGLPGRDAIRERLLTLLGSGSIGTPTLRRERRFFMRRNPEQEHAVLLVIEPDGTERVLLDPMEVDPSGTTTLDSWQPSKDGALLAYQLSEGGTEESVLRVIDVATGELVDGPIDRARYSPVAWLPGNEAYYYVRRVDPELLPEDERQYHRRVWLHRVGTDPAQDVEIFGAGREITNYYGVQVSMDGRWLVVSSAAGTAPRNDLWIADISASAPEAPELRVVQEGVDAQAWVQVGRDGRAYISTDRDAPRGRLCVADPEDLAYESWRDLVPEDPEAVLDAHALLDGPELGDSPVLLCSWTRHAVSEVTVHDLRSGERTGQMQLPGLGSIGGFSVRHEGGHEAWFGYTDHVTPHSIFHYDARTGKVSLYASPPGSVTVPEVSVQHVAYESKDGTTVRMFVIAPTATPDGPRPCVLSGYGGFGIALTPGYSASYLQWVEAGGVYAVACLRGGSEEGEEWHRAGMLGTKQNVFDDFHAAAEKLVADGWTTPAQLGISGGSNGGLLVGAALTQRPELFNAVVCSAPLLDMVRYEQFGLGATWNEEYGRADDPEELGWLLSYSPYHHVREGVDYPATLFTIFDGDTRVDTMHARKMAAALQHSTTGSRPVLVRREKGVGHGARALSKSVELGVDTTAFLAHWTGLAL
ncbi:prolyl oligopeptidase family serine peptidase [Motilibacter deserti]|uniref:prolyl oligopeptidase n=1 Tax=Motilibacter deserti TaxID=2714956 RepID=A0ABX0GTU5_9ACTN|nr:prolyl oligopeptidase family serine peptidase [Motilibacter deserti]NHC12738.1 S9 family peptidase [Motilibacter deserti]